MERQEDILGLTLSELAFFIVLVLLLLPLIGRAVEPPPEPTVDPTIEDLQEENAELRESLDLKDQENLRLEERLRELEGLRSSAKPTCKTEGLAKGHLFRASVVDIDIYYVDRERLSLSQLRSRFESDIAKASDAECTHTIEVSFSFLEGIDPMRPLKAVKDLERDFYVTRLLTSVPRPR